MTLVGGYKLLNRDGRNIPAIGLTITMKTNGESTRDAYSLFEYSVPGGTNGPPPHIHRREDESFVMLDGRLEVSLGGEEYVIEQGDYLYLPRDVIHAFRNPFGDEARVISVVSPAGLEDYYQALADMPPGPMDLTLVKKIMGEFGIEMNLPAGH